MGGTILKPARAGGGGARSGGDPLVGTRIAGRYEVVRLLGQGGMGTIYEVRHIKLNRTFVLKRLSTSLLGHPEALARFQREADVVASLRHPNIVEVTDWETLDDGSPCMILEHLHGEDLWERLRSGPLDWSAIATIADQVLSALAVAHAAGIVHRDLKPQNIFLARDDAGEERAKLLDFGVSKIHARGSLAMAENQLIGTPAYMSPEQADGPSDRVGPSSDVWAMGAILYEMATGQAAFDAETVPTVLYRICHGSFDPIERRRPDAAPAFVSLVSRALSRDPAERIVDVESLRRGLRGALGLLSGGLSPLAVAETARATPAQALMLAETLRKAAVRPVEELQSRHGGTDGTHPRNDSTLSRAAGERTVPAQASRAAGAKRHRAWLVGGAVAVALGALAIVRFAVPAAWPGSSVSTATPTVTPPAATGSERPAGTEDATAPLLVTVSRTPASARLQLDGRDISGDAVLVPRDRRRHHLRVSAEGFHDELRWLDATSPRSLAIPLRPKRTKKPGDQLLDP